MEQYIGPILICLFPAIISCLMLLLIEKGKININCFQMIMAFTFINIATVSVMKLLLGDFGKTIFQSFWDIELRTYIHYGIPICIIAVIETLLLKGLLQHKKKVVIDWFNSVLSGLFCVAFAIVGKITNEIYCIIFAVAVAVAIFVGACKNKQCEQKTGRKEKLTFSLKVILLFVFSVYIFNPSELFLNNITEFPISYSNFITVLLIGGAGIIGVYLILNTYFMNELCSKICNYIIFILTAAGYIQGLFFNGKMLALDGSRQEWSLGKIIFNLCVWFVIAAGVIILKRNRPKADKYIGLVCIYITLIQFITLVTMCITTEFPGKDENYALTTKEEFELHPDNNTIVFILDWYDEQILERLIEKDDEFLKPIQEFTWYQNTTSNYAFTAMSIPYLLTDVKWEYDMEETDYCKYAYENGHFLQDIAAQNYDIGIYTETQYVDPSVQNLIVNYSSDIERKCKFIDTISLMGQSSKYKLAPFIAKNMYWYATSDIVSTMENSNIFLDDNYSFYQDLRQNRIKINKTTGMSGVFRFYHLDGAHTPCTMTEEFEKVKETDRMSQAKGSMKIVYEYINQLKQLGLYDDATIIITADHGQNTMLDDANNLEGFDTTSNPILLVKMKNQKEGGISKAPVSHNEFAATVIQAIGGNSSTYGRTFDQISESENLKREFIYRRHNDIPYRRYEISGDVRNINNWVLAEDMR